MDSLYRYSGPAVSGRPITIHEEVFNCGSRGGAYLIPGKLTGVFESIPAIAQGLASGQLVKQLMREAIPEAPPPTFTYGEGLISLDEAMPIIEKYGLDKVKVRKLLRADAIEGAFKAGIDANDPWVIPEAALIAYFDKYFPLPEQTAEEVDQPADDQPEGVIQ